MTTHFAQWLVSPTRLPLIRRRCLRCPSTRFEAHGKFRINANHKLLDVWLLALCAGCGTTVKLTVLERANVRAITPPLLDRFHSNDTTLAAELLTDPSLQRRNGVTLDWTDAWTLRKSTATTPGTVDGSQVVAGPGAVGGSWVVAEPGAAACPDAGGGARPPMTLATSVCFAQPIPLRVTALLAVGLGISGSEASRLIAGGALWSTHRLTGRTSTNFHFFIRT
ncbi:DUF1062 domain-containing protein [Paractinoplanes brasiliensis]|uniref:DUF1062 domain-containing protein n=1 Tax=Paractinoplanes brasiliensis TaxID=52695 RepID=A0A4R6JAA7_9ACTN|nr:DUF1062 domain-containing protein [Actinoplanes brasiliensis]TDO32594.1 hypothetical protein C8E87_8061 [Actinoplanes brasiliensis]GID27527.1 hypothetical protein Abr02nite_25100 [Actinoplanes brasiliensis]